MDISLNLTTLNTMFSNATLTFATASTIGATAATVAQVDIYTDIEMGFIYLAMVLLSLLTVVGNIAVFVAYFRTPDLQNSTNYFILSLATADIIIGSVSVNFYTVFLAYGEWPLGEGLCDFWLCMDYWCSQASVLNLVVISVDRFLSIKYPIAYRSRRSDSHVKKAIVVIWVFSFLLWVPWIVFYQFIQGVRTVPKDNCYIQFLYESWYITIITACFAYFGPILLMCILYVNIYIMLLQRKRKVHTITGVGSIRDKSYESAVTEEVTDMETERSVTKTEINSFSANKNEKSSGVSRSATVRSRGASVMNKMRNGLTDHERAATLLIFIILAFAITWFPYDLFAVMAPFCETCISAHWWHFGYILCYVNSLINPICYAFGNKKFKRAFKNILCCRKR